MGHEVLAVDCDPNPTLAEELGLSSSDLDRFSGEDLRPAEGTLELVRRPDLTRVGERLSLLGGPPTPTALSDAVARGIGGVLVADEFDFVITDLGAGPELARVAVGGVLDPAEVCFILSDGGRASERTAKRVEEACRRRGVASVRVENRRSEAELVACELATELKMRHDARL